MKPISFEGQNAVYAANQPEYRPMPVYSYKDPSGRILCCWGLSWRERFDVLFRGVIWQQVLTFNTPLQPQLLTTRKPPITSAEMAGLNEKT